MWFTLLLHFLLPLLTTPTPQHIWSSQPLTPATISTPNIWYDLPSTSLSFNLPNESPVLLNYQITVRGFKPENSASDFLVDDRMSIGQKDFIQLRMVVDGVPLRQSSTHAQPGTSLEASGTSRTGYAVANLGAGNHTAVLQWKKRGTYVTSWRCLPSLDDGFSAGRVLSATSHHRYMWTREINSDDVISDNDSWKDMAEVSLEDQVKLKIHIEFPSPPLPLPLAHTFPSILPPFLSELVNFYFERACHASVSVCFHG